MRKELLNIAILVSLLFCIIIAADAETIAQATQKNFDVQPGGHLTLTSHLGAIDVKINPRNQVGFAYTKSARANTNIAIPGLTKLELTKLKQEALDDFEVTFTQEHSKIIIDGKFKTGKEYWQKKLLVLPLLEIRFDVTIPNRYSVNLNTSHDGISVVDLIGGVQAQTSIGDLRIGEIKGPVWGRTTSSGNVTLKRCKGNVDVETSIGDIDLGTVVGKVKAKTGSSGRITLEECQGNVDVKTAIGGITLGDVTGDVIANGGNIQIGTVGGQVIAKAFSSGNINLKTCQGNVDVEASIGDIDLGTVVGTVKAKTGSSGRISLKKCESDVDVETSIGDVELTNITGTVNARGGDIQISNVGGMLTARASSSGHITLKDCRDNVDVKASIGNIELTNITGTVEAKTGSSGRIRLNTCKNNVDVETSIGDVELTNITGTVNARGGDIQISSVGGAVTAQATSSGRVTLKDCRDNVDVKASIGNIELTNITGTAKVKTGSSGNIKVTNVNGAVQAEASIGNLQFSNVRGDVSGKTGSSGNITLNSCQGGVNVSTVIGDIHAEITRRPHRQSYLTTSGSGKIIVILRGRIGIDVDAQTNRGSISSDFVVQGTHSKNSLKGKINRGGTLLKLRTASGDIRLQKK